MNPFKNLSDETRFLIAEGVRIVGWASVTAFAGRLALRGIHRAFG